MNDPTLPDPWHTLRTLTQARIALGRSGTSLPTGAHLAFQLAHAQARDAVHAPLDTDGLSGRLRAAGYACKLAHSACPDRSTYLQRPDLGRQLDQPSRTRLALEAPGPYDLALVAADGLSALAIEQNLLPFLDALVPRLQEDNWALAPLVLVAQGRVAIGDDVGALLHARCVLVMIGERPGLSSPDSMGLYMSWAPRTGLSDAQRNCISNVRPAGLSYGEAAYRQHYLLTQARQRGLSGVALKDGTAAPESSLGAGRNFLLDQATSPL